VRFDDTQVLLITAEAGTFFHPGNVPVRGEFHGNTIVTLYESADDQPVDLNSERDIQMRLFLDEPTAFNREEGVVQSAGPVRLVRHDADFTGTGLDLTYNNLHQRLERLIIEQGDELRLSQSHNAEEVSDESSQTENNAKPGDGHPPVLSPDMSELSTTPPSDTTKEPATAQYYQAVLTEDVRVTMLADDTQLTGDRLYVLFSMQSTSSESAGSDANMGNGESVMWYVSTAPATTSTRDDRRLMTPAADDLLIHWQGPLVLTPIAEKPDALISERDMAFSLSGSPAELKTPAAESLTAQRVGYRAEDDRLIAVGSEAHPLKLQTPEVGTLTGRELWLEQGNAIGQVLGPGRLQAAEQGLDIDFADRLELAFYQDDTDKADALRSAIFIGNVQAIARGETDEDTLDISSDQLALELDRPEPGQDPEPRRLLAIGNVRAVQPGNTLTTQRLDVSLAKAPEPASEKADAPEAIDSQPATSDRKSPAIQVTRLRALGDVRVDLTQDDTELTAHALDADPRINRLELFGNEQAQATLTRTDATLTGQHLILLEDDQTADVLGPGTFSAKADPEEPESSIDIAWQQAMQFNNRSGNAHFVGQVQSTSASPDDATTLDAHALTLRFNPQPLNPSEDEYADADAANMQAETAEGEADQRANPALDLRRAIALAEPNNPESEVNFSAQTFSPDQPNQPVTRITLVGPKLTFINEPPNLTDASPINDTIPTERVVIDGRGKMLLEDFRVAESNLTDADADAEAGSAAEASGSPALTLAGPGVTLFAWERRLTLDAHANDMLIEKDVWMLHKPLDESEDTEPIKLDAQRLHADLTETGGLGAWLGGDAPTAQVRQIDADGAVRVTQGKSNVVSDHLRYTEADRQVILWADPGRAVTLNREDQPNGTTTAEALKWDLETNTFRGINPESGLIPLR
jgi:hypothetical protein